MAPNGMDRDSYLGICLKHAKEPIKVDFDSVAKETGMSIGGAQNKYRAIMKELQGENGAAASTATASPKATPKKATTTTPKRKRSAKSAAATTDEEDNDDDSGDNKPAVKKTKATPRKTPARRATPKRGKAVKEESEEDEKSDGVDGEATNGLKVVKTEEDVNGDASGTEGEEEQD